MAARAQARLARTARRRQPATASAMSGRSATSRAPLPRSRSFSLPPAEYSWAPPAPAAQRVACSCWGSEQRLCAARRVPSQQQGRLARTGLLKARDMPGDWHASNLSESLLQWQPHRMRCRRVSSTAVAPAPTACAICCATSSNCSSSSASTSSTTAGSLTRPCLLPAGYMAVLLARAARRAARRLHCRARGGVLCCSGPLQVCCVLLQRRQR